MTKLVLNLGNTTGECLLRQFFEDNFGRSSKNQHFQILDGVQKFVLVYFWMVFKNQPRNAF